MTQETKFSAGNIILFSEGEYSDYGYCGRVVALCDLDMADLAKEYLSTFTPEQIEDYYIDGPSPNGFVAWLCVNQKVAEITARELHLGSYGRLQV